MKLTRLVTITACVVILAPSAAAAHKRHPYPSGNSAANQYVEVVPSAGGGRPSSTITAHSGHNESPLSSSTVGALDSQGSTGRAAAALAQATAPNGRNASSAGRAHTRVRARDRRQPKSSAAIRTARSREASAVSQVSKALVGSTGGGGMGAALPAILGVITVVVIAMFIRSRRA